MSSTPSVTSLVFALASRCFLHGCMCKANRLVTVCVTSYLWPRAFRDAFVPKIAGSTCAAVISVAA